MLVIEAILGLILIVGSLAVYTVYMRIKKNRKLKEQLEEEELQRRIIENKIYSGEILATLSDSILESQQNERMSMKDID